jgi:hypothetical protein
MIAAWKRSVHCLGCISTLAGDASEEDCERLISGEVPPRMVFGPDGGLAVGCGIDLWSTKPKRHRCLLTSNIETGDRLPNHKCERPESARSSGPAALIATVSLG